MGDTISSTGTHNTFDTAQDIGNLLNSDKNQISVAGTLTSSTDPVWFKMDLNYDLVQSIAGVSNGFKTFATMFQIDYADGLSRPDTTISIFDSNGNLLLIGRDSDVSDDQPRESTGADLTNLAHGSFGVRDASVGTVQLPAGTVPAGDENDPQPIGGSGGRTYYIAVSSSAALPTILDATFKMEATNPLVRLEPVSSVAASSTTASAGRDSQRPAHRSNSSRDRLRWS